MGRRRLDVNGQLCTTVASLAFACVVGQVLLAAHPQDVERTVADGVYSDAQAERGAASYNAACSGCHRGDLGGATGPSLKEQRFARNFAGKELGALYTKIATTMPRNAPATLSDNVYLDIVAHILKENGFASGSAELTAEALPAVKVVPGRPKPPPPLGDFSYVETVGCLTPGPDGSWLLTKAAEPRVVVLPVGADRAARVAAETPAGAQTLRLIDAMAYNPGTHQGHKMYARGLLVRVPTEQRLTLSVFEMVGSACQE
jgi:mono/diheme cytochrome c family protein